MTRQGKSIAGLASAIVAGIIFTIGIIFAGGALSNRVERLEDDVKTKAPQKEVDELKQGVKAANKRLIRIMVKLGVDE